MWEWMLELGWAWEAAAFLLALSVTGLIFVMTEELESPSRKHPSRKRL